MEIDKIDGRKRIIMFADFADVLKKYLNRLLNLIYPPDLYCICCGNYIDDTRTYHLCDHCITHLHWNTGQLEKKNGISMVRCTTYGLYERTIIFSLKYNGRKYIARDIADIMHDRLQLTDLQYDLIVPVPMYIDKEKERGFNQATLMGKYLGKRVKKPFSDRILLRTEQTKSMRGLSPTERAENIKGKFDVREGFDKILAGKKILLVDDFFTTGSTARECAKVLVEHGADEVSVLVFAAK